jgi:Tfp pilus assembly protein PilF
MRAMKRTLLLAACALVVACGGSTPAPQSEATASGTSAGAPSDGAGGGGGGSSSGGVPSSSGGANRDYDEGVAALQQGDVEGARAIQKRMAAKDAKSPEAMVLLGLISEKAGDKAGAEKAYKDAIKLRPDLEAAYVDLSALLVDQARFDDALTVARAGIAKLPKSAGLHANAATVLAAKGDTGGATQEFDQAVAAAPNDAMLLMTYGHWLGAWKQSDAALAKLRAALPLAKDVGMLAAIGDEMRAIGAFTDCVPTLDKAIGMKDTPDLRTYRALCKLGAKDDAGATADLRAAVGLDAAFGPAHYYLAGRLAQGGDLAGAINEYETYVKLEPNGPLAKAARERIKKAKEHLKK